MPWCWSCSWSPIVTDRVNIAVVLVVMFLLGTAETFADTTTGALTPMVVGKRDLGIANARIMGGFIVANQLAGPPIGAALFAAGTAWPFVAQAVLVGARGGPGLAGGPAPPRRRPPGRTDAGARRHPRGLALAAAPPRRCAPWR